MPTLMIQLPGLAPVSHVLKDETSTIGRMKGNTVVIDDSSISLSHAKITRKNGGFYLKDLNSTNGTVVNGQSVNEVRLCDLDRVNFASVAGQFLMAEAALAAAAPAPNAGVAPTPALPAVAPSTPMLAAPIPVQATHAVAPTSRPSPTPSPKTVPTARPAAKPWRLAPTVSACVGGSMALAVVAFFGWKLFHPEQENSANAAAVPPLPSQVISQSASPERRPTRSADASSARAGLVAEVPKAAPDSLAMVPAPAATDAANPSISQLVQTLKAQDPSERRRAASALHSMGADGAEAVPALREALKDSDQEVRMWAALTLINDKCYDKATVPVLIGVLRQDNPVLRQVACLSLGLIPYDEAEKQTVIPALSEAAGKDSDSEVRKAAVSALNIIAPEAVAQASPKPTQ